MKNLQRIPSIHIFPIFNIILSFGNASLPFPEPFIPKKNRTTKTLHFLNDLYGERKKVIRHLHRHSFATHFLKQGVSLGHLQKLLVYGSSKIKEVYTHISKKSLANIKSPLDQLIEDQSDHEK